MSTYVPLTKPSPILLSLSLSSCLPLFLHPTSLDISSLTKPSPSLSKKMPSCAR